MFHCNNPATTAGKGVTQYGRALYELNVDTLCANSSQAKGRVERANLTLQDRLVKELRLRNIDTREAANAYLYHVELDELLAHPVQCKHGLVILRLDGHEAHPRTLSRLPDRRSVGRVVLSI